MILAILRFLRVEESGTKIPVITRYWVMLLTYVYVLYFKTGMLYIQTFLKSVSAITELLLI